MTHLDPGAVVERVRAAFAADAAATPPPMTLRGGNDLDGYDEPSPYDASVDVVTDAYIELHAFAALPHLDPASWRHHIPVLVEYSLQRLADPGDLAIEGLLWSLRPPDRDPPRLGSLSDDQEAAVVAFLDVMAFDERSAYTDLAMQAIEEYWGPRPLYRPR